MKDSVQVECVAVQDSVVEVTTITIDRNEHGDTLKQSVVTDRLRTRNRDRVKDVEVRTVVKTDTVFVAIRDSTAVERHAESAENAESWPSALARALKWMFWIIVAIGALVIGWKVSKIFSFRF